MRKKDSPIRETALSDDQPSGDANFMGPPDEGQKSSGGGGGDDERFPEELRLLKAIFKWDNERFAQELKDDIRDRLVFE